MSVHRAPRPAMKVESRATAVSRSSTGVRIQARPSNKSARAASSPPVAAPASGCPPTKRSLSGSCPAPAAILPLGAAHIGHDGVAADTSRGNSDRMRMLVCTGAARMTRSASCAQTRDRPPPISAACVRIADCDDVRTIDRDQLRGEATACAPPAPRRRR